MNKKYISRKTLWNLAPEIMLEKYVLMQLTIAVERVDRAQNCNWYWARS
jgi:hypothetical protein